jgi:PAS domain S-box-containing protein
LAKAEYPDAGRSEVEILRARLAAAETRLRASQESAGIGMAETDANGRYLWVNEAFSRITGFSREEALGLTLWDLTHPDDLPADRGSFERQVAGSIGSYSIEKRYRRRNGSFGWGLVTGNVVRDAADNFLYAVRTLSDVSELKRTEFALRQSESRLNIAVQAAGLGIWDWDVLTNTMEWSEPAKAMFGFPPGRPVSFEQVRDATHPEDLPRTSAMARAALDPTLRSREAYEYRIIRADGEIRWMLAHGEAVFAEIGGETCAIRYTGTIQDITERKRAADRLVENEARLRLAIDAAKLGIWEYDATTDRVSGTAELYRILGFGDTSHVTRADLVSRYYPGEQQQVAAAWEQALARGERYFQVEYRYLWPDGQVRWLLLRAEMMLDRHDVPIRAVGVVIDITDAKRSEEQRTLLIRELNHRVKNTLAVVQALAFQSLPKEGPASQSRDVFLARLGALAQAHDLLSAGEWHHLDIRDLVSIAAAPYRLPDGSSPFAIAGPSVHLGPQLGLSLVMVFQELATNAAKYGSLSEAGGSVTVSWEVEEAGPESVLLMTWVEAGGPPVAPPTRRGFGSRLIERTLAHEGGGSELDYHPQGLRCSIRLKLTR